ncbi:MAG TPA: glycosyltransferase, partial [Afifellaceae bacterium]|nr:glycosyltransferase [Afifellaceae bacterium]
AAPVSTDFRELLQMPEMQEALAGFSGKLKAWRHFRGMFRRQFDEMLEIARQVRPDMLVSNPKGFVAHHIAETLQIISIPTTLQPAFVPTGAFPMFMLPFADLGRAGNRFSHRAFGRLSTWGQNKAIGDWRKTALGLAPEKHRNFMDGYHPLGRAVPHLHGYSRHIIPKPDDWGAEEHVTGYWFLQPSPDWQPPDDLARFLRDGPPPVYIGFGSMPAKNARRQTAIVLEALRLSGQRGLLASGWGGLDSGGNSDTVHVLESAPHDWLFPRCSAVVHHGGAGTTHEALRWGRPSVICPFGVDQPFWGWQINRLGAGPKPIAQKRLTGARLAAAIFEALSPDVRSRASEIGVAIRQEDGADKAAGIIEAAISG